MRPTAPNSMTMIPWMSGRSAGITGATATAAAAAVASVKWSRWPQIRKTPRGPRAVTAKAKKVTAAATSRPPLLTWIRSSIKTRAIATSLACNTQKGIQRCLPALAAGLRPLPSLIGAATGRSGRGARRPVAIGLDGGRSLQGWVHSRWWTGLGQRLGVLWVIGGTLVEALLELLLGRAQGTGQLGDLSRTKQHQHHNNEHDDAVHAKDVCWRAEMHGGVSLVGCAYQVRPVRPDSLRSGLPGYSMQAAVWMMARSAHRGSMKRPDPTGLAICPTSWACASRRRRWGPPWRRPNRTPRARRRC